MGPLFVKDEADASSTLQSLLKHVSPKAKKAHSERTDH